MNKSKKLWIRKYIKKQYQNLCKICKIYDTEIEIQKEYKFHQYKWPISIIDFDVNKTVISIKFTSGKQDFKYFIGYKYKKK